VAAGKRAQVEETHPGTFLYADATSANFSSMAANEFAGRATVGVRFDTALDEDGAVSAEVELAPGSGSWLMLSDRDAKVGISPADGRKALMQVADLPISTLRYQEQSPSVRPMGPMRPISIGPLGVGRMVGLSVR
jgi:hypothetical protein